MAVKLAQGVWLDDFSEQLLHLPLGRSQTFLQTLPQMTRDELLEQYHQCKVAMIQRFIQVYSYWRELPWRLCAMGNCLFYTGEDKDIERDFILSSKGFAAEALSKWPELQQHGGHQHFHMARLFLDPSYEGNLAAYMKYWADSSIEEHTSMPDALAQE